MPGEVEGDGLRERVEGELGGRVAVEPHAGDPRVSGAWPPLRCKIAAAQARPSETAPRSTSAATSRRPLAPAS